MTSITPGTIVRARARRYLVVDVNEHTDCRSVRLAPVEGGGEPLTLLHPFDRFDAVPSVMTPKRVSRLRAARACAAAVRESYGAGETRALVDARVQLLPFQLEPALAILRGETTRVLLADEVGLGKTIQAGLILSELRSRHRLRRSLVLTPAGLRNQWAAELGDRFGLDATVIDAGVLAALQRSLPPWVNPWTLPGIAIASIDLLKRDELLPHFEHIVWDAVVVDEAHHATGGSDRRQIAALACSRARYVILVTATPHNGDRAAFHNLCELGSLDADIERPLRIFRRSRAEAVAGHDIYAEGVPQRGARGRRTLLVRVGRTQAETRMDAKLRSYTERVWREAGADARLAMVVLRKRALSGAASLARSVARRLETLGRDGPADPALQLPLDFTDTVGGDLVDDDRQPERELSARGLADVRTERQLLEELLEAARRAQREDSKTAQLVASVSRAREPVIIFTEYRDTLEDLRGRLAACARVTTLHGAMLAAERQGALQAFESGRARILLATDAAAEGLNLQRRCRWVIHHEVPWSPVRIEQRNGRVDRIGQSRRVHAWHLIAETTEEESVLARVAARASVAALDLGDQAIAAAVFGDSSLTLREPVRGRVHACRAAVVEAARVRSLRRLPQRLRASTRPLCSFRRKPPTLGIVRALVLDSRARALASTCIGVRAPTLNDSERVAARALGREASRTIAVHERFAAASRDRQRAIRHALLNGHGSPLQPSLFDRQLLIDAGHRQRALDRALAELADGQPARETFTVRVSLVGALSVCSDMLMKEASTKCIVGVPDVAATKT